MRVFILYIVPLLIVAGCIGLFVWVQQYSTVRSGPAALNAASPKALRAASDSVRCLDQILTDPMLISSSKWKEEATKAVNDWYNKG